LLVGGPCAYGAWRDHEARKPKLPDGVLSVRSDPPGAQVVVEGREAPGLTPLFARNLRRGVPLKVVVTREGYRGWSGTAKVRADWGDGVLLVKLEPAVGPASAPVGGAASAPAGAPSTAPAPGPGLPP
jgi:hypothetical protein